MKKLIWGLGLSLAVASPVLAADFSGTWEVGVREFGGANYYLPVQDGRLVLQQQGNTVTGKFNELTFSAEGSQDIKPWDEDLLNAAALQTIAHGGTVYLVPQNKIPENRPMAAIMRY